MLRAPAGATRDTLMTATEWQQHSVRGFLAGVVRKKLGLNLVSEISEKGHAHLRGLDLGGLRARWQSMFRRPAHAHLTRHLLFSVIAYQVQADRYGDLDHATSQV